MKRLLPVMLAVALLVPASSAFAAKGTKKAKKVAIERCSGDRDVKSVSLGKEVVYVSEDLKSASFAKDEKHTQKHNLMYYSAKTEYSRRTPGVDKEGNALVPAFKHGDVWHVLSRDENGNLVVDGAAAPVADTTVAPADEKKEEVKKPAKKAKKSKKAKKAKKAKKVEEKAAEPAAAPAAEPAPTAAPATEGK
ncbi:MAG TPA: hypothetical protein VIV61_08720 [Candidatus Ozemobacteraceae bacterium]